MIAELIIHTHLKIPIDLREKVWKGLDWIHLVQDRGQWRSLENTAMKLRVPYEAGNFLTS
jgi:hypothetical protein